MANKVGLIVNGGGKELNVLTPDGKYVTSIPNTLKGKQMAEIILRAIIDAVQ